jgi:hypothetical protein
MPESPRCPAYKSALFDLLLIAVLVVYAVSAILSFWMRPYLLAPILLPAPLALIHRLGPAGSSIAAAGALIGPATEMACVAGGLWSYSQTGGLPLIPPWLFVIWACFPTALWLIVRSVLGETAAEGPARKGPALPLCLAGIALQIALFVALSKSLQLIIASALLFAGAIVYLSPAAERKTVLVLLASGAVLGPVCEALPVASGAWSYARPDLFGMPLWLPLAYALFAVLVAFAARAAQEAFAFADRRIPAIINFCLCVSLASMVYL